MSNLVALEGGSMSRDEVKGRTPYDIIRAMAAKKVSVKASCLELLALWTNYGTKTITTSNERLGKELSTSADSIRVTLNRLHKNGLIRKWKMGGKMHIECLLFVSNETDVSNETIDSKNETDVSKNETDVSPVFYKESGENTGENTGVNPPQAPPRGPVGGQDVLFESLGPTPEERRQAILEEADRRFAEVWPDFPGVRRAGGTRRKGERAKALKRWRREVLRTDKAIKQRLGETPIVEALTTAAKLETQEYAAELQPGKHTKIACGYLENWLQGDKWLDRWEALRETEGTDEFGYAIDEDTSGIYMTLEDGTEVPYEEWQRRRADHDMP